MTERRTEDGPETGSGGSTAPKSGDGADDFAQRLKRARMDAGLEPDPAEPPPRGAMAEGLQRATELVAGVIVGAFIGWWFDSTFNTTPFGMIGFFFLGAVAGIWNVVRSARRYNKTHGTGSNPDQSDDT